jgi:ABC-type sugar transport system, permease component
MRPFKKFSMVSALIYIFLAIFAFLCIIPIWYTFVYSITPYSEYLKNPTSLLPRAVNLDAYAEVLKFDLIHSGMRNTIFITLVGTVLHLFLLLITAYPLSKSDLKGSRFFMFLFVFTMYFSGGIIPDYFLMRNLGLLNSLWSLILSSVNGAYSLILMRTFLKSIPPSLEEAATIDGANDFTVLFKIIIPLSLPSIATLALFHAVGAWNEFFRSIIYMTKRQGWPLQLVLRELVIENNQFVEMQDEARSIFPFNIKMATIIISVLPIICLYPFLQKYFITGLTLGAVKE